MTTGHVAVCVFCASSTTIDASHLELASRLGQAIAERGWTLVSGGGSVGSMGAVARAARAAGGHTVGVIPQALVDLEVADHEADEFVVTPDMRERKAVMDDRADAFIALPGGLGTLEELLEIWVARSLGMHAKPIVVLDPADTYAALHTLVDHLVKDSFVRPVARDAVHWARTLDDALDQIASQTAAAGARSVPTAEELLEAEP